MAEEILPKLNKLKEERTQYLEFQRMERELQYMLGVHKGWQYHLSVKYTKNAEKSVEDAKMRIDMLEQDIEKNKNDVEQLEENIKNLMQSNQSVRFDLRL